ncbi:PBP1A family penicillin-binding protein [Candidatus Falkowbacteria bacterium]|nr:PBP1A family penicillin-binding protein [Candidatus Falkowbacteria bacterium]
MSLPSHIHSGKNFPKKRRWFRPKPRGLSLQRLSYGQRNRRERLKAFANYLVSLGIVAAIFGALFLLFIFAWTTKDLPDPGRLSERNIQQTTTIYDRDAKNILYQLHGDVNRRLINLSDMPDYVKWTAITAEDRDFYNHQGFSLRGMLRSFIMNIFSSNKVGGSTITQQFVKNAILSPEKTYTRKIKELVLAYRIENKFTKDEILQLYFNEIPYGSVIYGIEAASQSYFGLSAKDLNLAQAAVLAAMTQRPTYFSPYGNNVDRLFERQRYILNEMVDLGYVTETQAETAKAEPIEFKPRNESIRAPHFVMYVRELLAEKYGERYAEEAGLKITTTLNTDLQAAAEKAVTDHSEGNRTRWNATNAALVSLDAHNGQILAMVGSADFYDEAIDGQVNVTLRARQPGSSFKPLAYATAFSRGYTPETVLYDVVTTFKTDGADYTPHDYDLKERGPLTMRQALAGSLNIPAVQTLYLAGVGNVLDFAEKLGYSTLRDRSRFGLSLVLGGGEVKLLEHTAAYAAFAREGVYHAPVAILKIEDANGNTLYEYKTEDNPGIKAIEPEPIRSLTSILSDNSARTYIFGEKNYLTLPDRPVAAKTGTTNDYRDAWTVGYTPSIATGVWVGNNDNSEMKRGADGSVVAAPIWNQYMRAATASLPVEGFNEPPANDADKPVLRGELSGVTPVKIDRISGKLATEFTPAHLVEERVYNQFHCILYYVNKDDPRGAVPSDPFADPQFAPCEDAVHTWVQKQGYTESGAKPPAEYDDIHTPDNTPLLEINSPNNGATISGGALNASVTVLAKRGVARVEYLLDGAVIANVQSAPWSLNYSAGMLSGIHTLTVKTYDDVENVAERSIDLNFLVNN